MHLRAMVDGQINNLALTNVILIPKLKKNLISVKKATEHEKSFHFSGLSCEIIDKSDNVIACAEMSFNENLYVLVHNPGEVIRRNHGESAFEVESEMETAQLWHARFGHLGLDGLRKLVSNDMTVGLSCTKEDLKNESLRDCIDCAKGKQTRSPFPKVSARRAEELFELIHSDVCGPMPHPSLGNGRYFVTFIDDKSRFVMVYILHSKDEVFEKNLKNMSHLLKHNSIQKLRV